MGTLSDYWSQWKSVYDDMISYSGMSVLFPDYALSIPTILQERPAKTQINCASAQADQSLRWTHEDALESWVPTECPTKTGQIVRMHRLIRVFAGRTNNLIGNAVPRLILS